MRKILIVEDDEDLASILQTAFVARGFSAKAVYDGEEALREIIIYKPDLVVLDIMLPKIDGWEVCGSIKSDNDTKNISVVIITGKTGNQYIEKGKMLGTDKYFTKPFDMMYFMRFIEDLLMNKKGGCK